MGAVRTSGDGYEVIMYAEPTDKPGDHELVAVVAWKGNAWSYGSSHYAIAFSPVGNSILQRLARRLMIVLFSPLLAALWMREKMSGWNARRVVRSRQREAWPAIVYRKESNGVVIDGREFAIQVGRTLVLLVEEHDRVTGRVIALTEHAIAPRVRMSLPTEEDRQALHEAMRDKSEKGRRAVLDAFSERFGSGANGWRKTLEADPVYQGFMARAAQ